MNKKQLDEVYNDAVISLDQTPIDLIKIIVEYIDDRKKCSNCRIIYDLDKIYKCKECAGYFCNNCEPTDGVVVNFICEDCFIDKMCDR